jgi:hypothetical protein
VSRAELVEVGEDGEVALRVEAGQGEKAAAPVCGALLRVPGVVPHGAFARVLLQHAMPHEAVEAQGGWQRVTVQPCYIFSKILSYFTCFSS